MENNLNHILNPRTVAVIGASRRTEAWGYRISKFLLENFKGKVYLVNPKADSIMGQKVYGSVEDIDEGIDLAVVAVPAQIVEDAVRDCAKKHVKGIVVIAGGFGEESGHWAEGALSIDDGKKSEAEMVNIARQGNSRLIGPNCLGIYNPSIGLSTYGGSQVYPQGHLAFISQSGNLGRVAFTLASKKELGFSYYISVGNEADLQFHEYIKYLRDDKKTKIIAMYIEGLKDGNSFLRETRKTSRKKPLVALKVGRTEAGARAAASHTGSLAGKNEIYDAAFKQAGIITVFDDNELFDVLEAFAKQPPLRGKRIGLFTEGGGHATIAADLAEKFGLKIPILSDKIQESLKKILIKAHPLSETKNPIDIPGLAWDPSVLADCYQLVINSNEVDGIVIVGLFGDVLRPELEKATEETAYKICQLALESKKPLLVHSLVAMENTGPLKILRKHRIPIYNTVSRAMRSMAALGEHFAIQQKPNGEFENTDSSARLENISIINKTIAKGRKNLLEHEAMELLKKHQIPIPEFYLAKSKDAAVNIANNIGYPVVMKIVSPQIIHKSDVGGVRINIKTKEEVEEAFEEIIKNATAYDADAEIFGVIIYPFIPKGLEIIIGLKKDPQFGPVLMFGLGGIFVEVLKDVSFRVAPLTKNDAYEMIREIRGYPILKGIRGEKPKDIDSVVEIILKLSQLAIDNPRIKELDLNPVIVHEIGATVVDARIILDKS